MKQNKSSEGQFWADKLMDLDNLMAAVLIFGQFSTTNPRWDLLIVGVALYIVFVILAAVIRRRKA